MLDVALEPIAAAFLATLAVMSVVASLGHLIACSLIACATALAGAN